MKPIFYFLRSKLSHVVLIISFLGLVQGSQATTYYFSASSGDDSRTITQAKSQSTPWKSLSKLNSMFGSFSSGDSILFQRGDVFTGSINITKAGLVFAAYGTGVNPVISGFTDLTWTNVGGNIWESQALSVKPNIVLVSGVYTVPSRMPKSGFYTFESSSGNNSITDNQLTGSWTGGEVIVRKNHTTWDRGIITQSGTNITFSPADGNGFVSNGWGYFIQNHINACTTEGEWAYSSSTAKIKIFSSATPVNCKASQFANLISTNGYSAVFDGIDLTGSNEIAATAKNISSGGFVIKNAAITNSGGSVIYLYNSANCIVENCTITDTNNEGIQVSSCPGIIIRNNSITNTGKLGQGPSKNYTAIGVYDQSTNAVVEFNKVVNTGHNGIEFYFSNGVRIRNNFVDVFNTLQDDAAGIYSYLASGNGTYTDIQVTNNIVLNGMAAPQGRTDAGYQASFGIYMDDNVSNVTVSGNTVANCAMAGLFLHSTNNISVLNNTLYNNGNSSIDPAGASQMFLASNSYQISNITCTGNILFAKETYQYPLQADYTTNTIGSSFVNLDNNYYCHPIKESSYSARTYVSGTPTAILHTLSGWKSYTGKDVASSYTAKTITSTSDLRFEYNATSTSKLVSLGATYVDAKGTTYAGSITLAPYSSAVLIYQSGTINQPPTANAGSNQSITLPVNTVTLTGIGTDTDGSIASYQWSKIAGPATFTIASAASAQTAVNNLVQGTYQFALSVTDNQGAVGTSVVTITVLAPPPPPVVAIAPVANAGADQVITLPTSSVTLNGIGTDADGTVVSYQWTKIAGPATFTMSTSTYAKLSVKNMVEGEYLFTLRVTDNIGLTGFDTVKVTVNPDASRLATSLVYPNPATSYINVVVDGKSVSNKSLISVYNSSGIILYQKQLEKSSTTTVNQIDVSRFVKGAYLVKILYSPTKTQTLKFMIQ